VGTNGNDRGRQSSEALRQTKFGSIAEGVPYELKTESTKERSPTELRCASFPARLSVTWGAVKGQDERPLFGGALDSSPRHHRRVMPMERWNGKQLIRKAATSALTFMTFS
jgi:hypothetical protein